ncbi:hypothetical protein NDU88_003943 [Pleurodeles waltl]|uniref:Uncharacterized protein n=1 Tax=Pleurodeles waltl TaxID=8319 RepID=A0AAV7M4X8_PLEWA|nr:hypothetical protein NDU88_003943 [Pleurodeles waltl]
MGVCPLGVISIVYQDPPAAHAKTYTDRAVLGALHMPGPYLLQSDATLVTRDGIQCPANSEDHAHSDSSACGDQRHPRIQAASSKTVKGGVARLP